VPKLNLKEIDDVPSALRAHGFPEDSLPGSAFGKYSYTVFGNAGCKIEVNVKQRHFRVIAVNADMDPKIGAPNFSFSKFGSLADAWAAVAERAGFYASP
jgi:hypothetical protein